MTEAQIRAIKIKMRGLAEEITSCGNSIGFLEKVKDNKRALLEGYKEKLEKAGVDYSVFGEYNKFMNGK